MATRHRQARDQWLWREVKSVKSQTSDKASPPGQGPPQPQLTCHISVS